ncbi:dethiobiotin synthase [Flavobacterium cerinum]|uniref:ATP-dependent dethiobiotin synthetase BioD n=1 Tax=Flavobacterium cerinum TaxID=2502784 RepID=A0ABY5IUG8_9FLAO|nr:dethiobiotin synthase [Flavobacterium cerinum]UUC46471.1 dethiobiotin synthase [Flavobacterium cerinum]
MKLFVTGIGTDVGKTVVATVLTEALEADYWKPVQAGDLDYSDSHKIKEKLSNTKTRIFDNAYALHTPASPHVAAKIDNVVIDLKEIKEPKTKNHLVIEGAGGILVPLNDTDSILDLIQPDYKVIVVSRHYLGSINHTLLTIEVLKARGLAVAGIIFSGKENSDSESIILNRTGVKMLGRIDEEPYFDKNVIREYADHFETVLQQL